MNSCPACGTEVRSVGVGFCNRCEVYLDWTPPKAGTPAPIQAMADDEPRLIVFPWPMLVSVNDRAGGMVGWTSAKYRRRLEAMTGSAKVQAAGWPKLTGPVRLAVWYHPPDERRRDCSNLDKAIMDALIGSVYEDDAQVVEWAGYKMAVSADPRAVVEVVAIRREQDDAA